MVEPVEIREWRAERWTGLERWGLAWSRPDAPAPAWQGIGAETVTLGELCPEGPPQLYRVVTRIQYGDQDGAMPDSRNETVKLRLVSALGGAKTELLCDLEGSDPVVPAGVVTVKLEQTGQIRRWINRVDVGLARAHGYQGEAWDTYKVQLTDEIFGGGYPNPWRRAYIPIPTGSRRVRIRGGDRYQRRAEVAILGPLNQLYEAYDNRCRELITTGVDLPPSAAYCQVSASPYGAGWPFVIQFLKQGR